MFKILLLTLLFLLQINTVYSAVYKWTDENGKTVYGDKPISKNANLMKIKKALRHQPVNATHALNRSAGVSKSNVFRGRSLSWRATALSFF